MTRIRFKGFRPHRKILRGETVLSSSKSTPRNTLIVCDATAKVKGRFITGTVRRWGLGADQTSL